MASVSATTRMTAPGSANVKLEDVHVGIDQTPSLIDARDQPALRASREGSATLVDVKREINGPSSLVSMGLEVKSQQQRGHTQSRAVERPAEHYRHRDRTPELATQIQPREIPSTPKRKRELGEDEQAATLQGTSAGTGLAANNDMLSPVTPKRPRYHWPPPSPSARRLFPLQEPSCRLCRSPGHRRLARQTNENGNEDRYYYVCPRCNDNGQRGWISFDDARGVYDSNPLCECDMPSRKDLARSSYFFYKCATGTCNYWEPGSLDKAWVQLREWEAVYGKVKNEVEQDATGGR